VTPFFERPSVQETLGVPAEIRVWQEDESPTAVIANWLKEHRLDRGQIGIEETVRFFASDGLGKLLPGVKLVSANPVVRGCRMHKTPPENALIQKANDVTIAANRWTAPRIQEGMTRDQVAEMIVAATQALGGNADGALVLLGEAAAYPHGSGKPQFVREGEVVLIDCGCTVDGYASDISRTLVFGKVPADVRRVFETVAEGQKVAMRTAQLGTPAGKVDDAVRAFYEREGYGPDYKLPGLSHRTGHGIGMDGHEPVNLVHGETTPLEVGMCFSNEPGLYFPGKFGVRLEDCFHMTPAGPKFFSEPPSSIDQPV
jgi:Xaa-Pro dipeptidase